MEIIEDRICELKGLVTKRIASINKPYEALTESERIPLRIMIAEIEVLKAYLRNEDLDSMLSACVDGEHFEGEAGLRRAKDWLKKNNLI